MTVVVWIVEGTWPACVDAARTYAADGSEIVLVHVADEELPAIAHGAFAGLLGRGRPDQDPSSRLEELAAESARQLLEQAADRLDLPCTRLARTGRIEREVIAAAQDADLLIVARDGDRSRLGPHSLARTAASSSTTPPAPSSSSGPKAHPTCPASRPRRTTRPTHRTRCARSMRCVRRAVEKSSRPYRDWPWTPFW